MRKNGHNEAPAVDNGVVPENTPPSVRLLTADQVAQMLQLEADEVIALVIEGRLRGVKIGTPPTWRIEHDSVGDYVDDLAEEARRIALWHGSHLASFPELWGRGSVRDPD